MLVFVAIFESLFLALVYDQRQRSLVRSFKQEKLQFIYDAQIAIADIPITIDVTADIRAGKFVQYLNNKKNTLKPETEKLIIFLLLLLLV